MEILHERIYLVFGIRTILMNEYYSVFGIRKFFMNEYIRYSKNFNERILFGIRKFFMNEYIRYSVFKHFSLTNTIRYSEILHGQIYSVFGIRSNSLFGATDTFVAPLTNFSCTLYAQFTNIVKL